MLQITPLACYLFAIFFIYKNRIEKYINTINWETLHNISAGLQHQYIKMMKKLLHLVPITAFVLLSSCEESKTNTFSPLDSEQPEQAKKDISRISTQEELERLRSHGILGSLQNRELSDSIIDNHNRYMNGDASIKDFPYIAAILSLTGDIPISCITVFIREGANINQKGPLRTTPLSNAAREGHTEIVKLLLEAKADPNQDDYSNTPLSEATFKGHTEIVKLLLEAKANPNQDENNGYTPLLSAAFKGHTEIVKLLLEAKANPNQKDSDARTPLLCAALKGHMEIVKLLLEAKADPNQDDNHGDTPLLRAALKGHTEVVKLLLEAKADPNHKDKYAHTPLSYAKDKGHTEIVKLLLEAKADPKDEDSKTH